jgi:hypothetical protein
MNLTPSQAVRFLRADPVVTVIPILTPHFLLTLAFFPIFFLDLFFVSLQPYRSTGSSFLARYKFSFFFHW